MRRIILSRLEQRVLSLAQAYATTGSGRRNARGEFVESHHEEKPSHEFAFTAAMYIVLLTIAIGFIVRTGT